MAPRDKPKGDGVGYGRPPVEHRFRKGKSGNPRGRPKLARSVDEAVHRRLLAPVTITENGKPRTMTMFEVILMRLIKSAVDGDTRAAGLIAKFAPFARQHADGAGSALPKADPKADRAALESILASMGFEPGASGAPRVEADDDTARVPQP